MIQPFILATAGHVDHGKSRLVHALTGSHPDRLPEEKRRGISIDLGFAHLLLPAPPQPSPTPTNPNTPTAFSCGIVDVPGHEDFVKNMVAGVGAVDLALLVVAADDGWMPQTEEHLQILAHLRTPRAVVALTKSDLVPAAHIDTIADAVRSHLADSPFAHAPIVPTSIPAHLGLDTLRLTLARELAAATPPADSLKPRLPIDRVFSLPGVGTIVTGTLTGGSLARGDSVVIQPSGLGTRIRSCQSHGRESDRALPGTRTALNLPDLATSQLRRGDVVTLPGLGEPSACLDVWVTRSPRPHHSPSHTTQPLPSGTRLHLHLGTARIPARLVLLDRPTLPPGQSAPARLHLHKPILAFAGDAFLLRDAAEQSTLAGGLVLDPQPPPTHPRNPSRLARLHDCAAHPLIPDPWIAAALQRHPLIPLPALLPDSHFPTATLHQALHRLARESKVVLLPNLAADPAAWRERLDFASRAIDQHHRDHPEQPGLPVAHLLAAWLQAFPDSLGFDEALAALLTSGFHREAHVLRRTAHTPAIPPHLLEPVLRLRDQLTRNPLDPPGRASLAPDPASRQALRFLLDSGEAVELAPDIVLARPAFAFAHRRIVAHLRRHSSATTSELRQRLDMHRRVLIPLLEHLDRLGITRRLGDVRHLPPPPANATNPPAPAPGTDAAATPPPPHPCPPGSTQSAAAPPATRETRTDSER